MDEYRDWEKEKLSSIHHDIEALEKMVGSEKMGESFDSGLLAGMLQKQGIDPGILAMMKDNDGFGNNGGLWVLLLFLLILGRGGFGAGSDDVAKNSTVINEANYSRLMDAISTQGTRQEVAIGDLANSVGASIGDVRLALASMDKQIALSEGSVQKAICDCCCKTNLNIERAQSAIQQDIQQTRFLIQAQGSAQDAMIAQKFADQNAYLASQFCEIKNREDAKLIADLQQRLADAKNTANTQAILSAIANKDTVSVSGNLNTTSGTWSGNGTLS